jgi:hypothetical protein
LIELGSNGMLQYQQMLRKQTGAAALVLAVPHERGN